MKTRYFYILLLPITLTMSEVNAAWKFVVGAVVAFVICTGIISAQYSSKNEGNEVIKYAASFANPLYINGQIFLKDKNTTYHYVNAGEGYLRMPYVRYSILIPYGKRVVDVTVEFKDSRIALRNTVLAGGWIYSLSNENYIHKKTFYVSKGTYPLQRYYYDIGFKRGFGILTLDICPVQFRDGTIYYSKHAEISIVLTSGKTNPLYRGIEDDKKEIKKYVFNPWILNSYPSIAQKQNNTIKYLIITKQELLKPFITLKKHKEGRYITTYIETIENISSIYPGNDLQEKIRNCIKDYYQNHYTEFVLLGGDTFDASGNEYVPHRGLYDDINVGVNIYTKKFPCDLYYAGLDGNWNPNGDDKWGDHGEEDWLAEVYVGRAPVNSLSEAWTFVNKTIAFEKSSRPNKAFLHAEDDPYAFGDMSVVKKNSGGYAAKGVEYYLPSGMQKDEMFEAHNYPTITVSTYSNHIISSPLFVNHCGHGQTESYIIDGSDDTEFTRNDAMALQNDFYPIHLSIACYSGAFDGGIPDSGALQTGGDIEGGYTSDYDCLAEDYIKNPNGGMAACVLNSRFGLGYSNDPTALSGELDNWFYEVIYDETQYNIGIAVQWSRERYHPVGQVDDNYKAYKWVVYDFNLLGDPEMPVIGDDYPPVVQIISPENNSYLNTPDVDVEWYGSDVGSGIDHYEISIDSSPPVNLGKATTYTFYNLSQGYHTIAVKAVDKFGNSAVATVSFWIDLTPPEVTIISPEQNETIASKEITVKWHGSDTPTYIDHYEVRIDNHMYRKVGNNTTYTFRDLSEGKHVVYIKAVDKAKNTRIVSVEFVVDTKPPEIYITSPSNGTMTNSTNINIVWRAYDYTTNIEEYRVMEGSSLYYEGEENSCSITLSEGIHEISVYALDTAGNVGTAEIIITVDLTPPDVWFENIYDGYVCTSSKLNLTWYSEDNFEVKAHMIYLDGKLVGSVDGETYNLTINDLRDGKHQIKIVAVDTAGNKNTYCVNITVDTLPGGRLLWVFIELIILLLVIIAIIMALAYHRKKKKI